MSLVFSRSRGAAGPREAETVQWLAPSRVRTSRPGDTLVVLLASALLMLLGLTALTVRFGSSPGESTANTLAALPQPVLRAPAPAMPARLEQPDKAVVRSSASAAQETIVATPIAPVSLSKLDPPITGAAAISAIAPITTRVQADASAFAPMAIPSVPAVRREEAEAVRETARAVEPLAVPRREARPAPEPEAEAASAPVRVARAAPEATDVPEPRKGGSGATWAVYFDHFPDMKSAAAKVNVLQGKYGPFLAGRSLTYGRSAAGGYRMRVTGLTEDAAQAVCNKVKSSGSLCAVGGK